MDPAPAAPKRDYCMFQAVPPQTGEQVKASQYGSAAKYGSMLVRVLIQESGNLQALKPGNFRRDDGNAAGTKENQFLHVRPKFEALLMAW
jgi:hypothetical protein